MVAIMLLPVHIGTYLLGHQPSSQAAGGGCGKPALHCKECAVLYGCCQGDRLPITLPSTQSANSVGGQKSMCY